MQDNKNNWLQVYLIAGTVIKKGHHYLLVQEKDKKVYGLWNLPAGHVDIGETIEHAAQREALEETGYRVKILKKIGIFHEDGEQSVKYAYLGKIIRGNLNFPKDEILDAKWFTLQEIKKIENKLRGSWVLESIKLVD